MNKTLATLAAGFFIVTIAAISSKILSRNDDTKATPYQVLPPIQQPSVTVPPALMPQETEPQITPPEDFRRSPDNKWANATDTITEGTILTPLANINLPKDTTETWLIDPTRNFACAIFYESSHDERVLERGTELQVDWIRTGQSRVRLPGNRQSSIAQECVVKCHTQGGVHFHLLMVAGQSMQLVSVPNSEMTRWRSPVAQSPAVAHVEKMWNILLPPVQPIKVPWPN